MDKEQFAKELKKNKKRFDKAPLILELCANKSVLDVGCVGQDYSYKNPLWLHKRISKVCSKIDGVDINQMGIDELKGMGISVYHADELTKTSNKYDVILMADVIEHVNDPVEFLKFYSPFLDDNGVIIITTPNAHGVRNLTSILVRNDYSLNPEHTFWFCPKTLAEVVTRASLTFDSFYWLNESFTYKDLNTIKNKIIYLTNMFFIRLRSNFNPNFMIIVKK